MTLLNFTFQEASPLISYSVGWEEGSRTLDPLFSSYNGSFRTTQTQSTASFTFLGTAVSLFGATRPNHGNYTVNLDQQPQFMASGFTDTNIFNKSLWHADQLAYIQHTVTLTNVPLPPNNTFLDLDFVSIERQIGQPGDTIYQLSLDDMSPSVQFVGPWHSITGVSSAYQGTLHRTQDAGAQVTFSFQGASLEVYGQYANAPYTVVLDNAPPVSLRGLDVDLTPDLQHPQTLLYLVDGLSDGVYHTVTLTNSIANVNRSFYFDYAVVGSRFNLNATSPSPSPSQRPGGGGIVAGKSHQSRQIPAAAIVGGVVGALAVIVILGISVFIRRKRLVRNERRREPIESEDSEVTPYIRHTAFHSSDEPREQRQSQSEDRPPPPIPHKARGSAPRSKHRSVYYLSNPASQSSSISGPPSSQERSESNPSHHVSTAPSTTSVSGSQLASRSGSTSRREKQTWSRSLSSRSRTGSSRGATFHDEDAGIVIDPEEMSMLKPLPPAYNPTWGRS